MVDHLIATDTAELAQHGGEPQLPQARETPGTEASPPPESSSRITSIEMEVSDEQAETDGAEELTETDQEEGTPATQEPKTEQEEALPSEPSEVEPPEPAVEEKKPAKGSGKKAKVKLEPEESPTPAAAETALPVEEKPPEDTKRWYVVKVQSGREDTIKEAIERRVKIESLEEYYGQILIPVEKEKVLHKGKRVERERKLYPGYIMAKVDFNDQILYLFRETSGVGDFVGGGPNQKPIPMTEREVERMLGIRATDVRPSGQSTAAAPYTIGERVKIKEGVFSDMEGDVKEVLEAKEKIRVEVFVMGRPVSVELDYWEVELV